MDDISISDLLSSRLYSLDNVKDFVIYFQKYDCRCTEKIFPSVKRVISYISKYLGEIVGFYRGEDGKNYYQYHIILNSKIAPRGVLLIIGVNNEIL